MGSYVEDSLFSRFSIYTHTQTHKHTNTQTSCHSINIIFSFRFVGTLIQSSIGAWIGLNDRKSESRFIWNDGYSSPDKYRSWRDGEPNNYNAQCNIENCVIMSKGNGKWADSICNGYYRFVCEAPFTNCKYLENTILLAPGKVLGIEVVPVSRKIQSRRYLIFDLKT